MDAMSYLVLARKWRPKRFAELVGQEHVVRALSNALDSGRVHHAYLFTGTRGVGKTTIAPLFAQSLNCEHCPGADPCRWFAPSQAIAPAPDIPSLRWETSRVGQAAGNNVST